MNTKIIKFDLNKYKLYENIKAKQKDTKSRFLLFQLLDGSIPFDLTNRSVRAYMIKPDGNEIFNDLIINNYSLGYCTLELTNQVLAVPGKVKIELMITEEDKKLTSSVFELEVIKSINSENSIVSTNEFTALLNGLASLSEYDNYKNEIKNARGGEVKLKDRLDKFGEQLDTIVLEKADNLKVDNVQQQVNNLVLGAVGDGNNAEVIQARGKYSVLNERLNEYDNSINYINNSIYKISPNIFDSSLYDKKSLVGINITYDPNTGYLTIDGTCTAVGAFWNDFIFNTTGSITASIRYISGSITGSGIQFDLYNTDNIGIPIGTATSSFCSTGSILSKTLSNINLKQSRIYVKNGTVCNNLVIAIQVEKGNTITDYIKFKEKFANFLDKTYADKIDEMYNNNFITDGKEDLGYFSKGGVVICVDDGTEYDKPNIWNLIKEYNIPFVFALMKECHVCQDSSLLTELKRLISDYKCEVCLHGSDTMSSWEISKINSFYQEQIEFFNKNGIQINNFVAPQNESSVNMRHVGQNYFDMMFSEFPNKNGVTIENKNRTNRYKLSRTSITPGFGTAHYFPRMLRTKTEGLLYVMYIHSVALNDSSYVQLLKNIIEYAKSNSITITTFRDFFNNY